MSEEIDKYIKALALGNEVPDSAGLRAKLDEFGLGCVGSNTGVALADRLELLDANEIDANIGSDVRDLLSSLELHWSLGSTNTYLLERSKEQGFHGSVCMAEQQTAGRGRRGRNWVSPFGKNIYLSIGWTFPETRSLDGLSLAIGCCVTRAIRACAELAKVKLKWPNDLLINGGKTAGILVEIAPGPKHERKVVVGVGINLQISQRDSEAIDQAWSVVSNASRNKLAAALVSELAVGLQIFDAHGFASFCDDWNDLDEYKDQKVNLISAAKTVEGICRGVDEDGCLRLEVDGVVQKVNAGELSLRPVSR